MCSRTTLLIAFLAMFMAASVIHAEMYKYKDKNGRVHYTDKPPANFLSHPVTVKINTYSSSFSSNDEQATPAFPAKHRAVTIYTASWCGICAKAIAYMRRNGIAYTEYDIEKSTKGRHDFKRMKGQGVPIILVGKMRMNGFNSGRFERMLEQ